jgi:23S rRNA (uracil1939-C5)-methyltransferase
MIVTIDRLGHLGDGVGLGPDGPIFVHGVLPGEVVDGTLHGDRLTDVKIVTPSPDRVKPPCRHARTCGGCLLPSGKPRLFAWPLPGRA